MLPGTWVFLEVFQWSGQDATCDKKLDKIKEELADVVNYIILMADACGLDLDEIVSEKVRINNEKYPVEKAFGTSEKYTELDDESAMYIGRIAFINGRYAVITAVNCIISNCISSACRVFRWWCRCSGDSAWCSGDSASVSVMVQLFR